MRYAPGHKEQTRERILEAASRHFRAHGYEGIGVDGLAKEAGVTSGAFYGHFASKAEAFRAAVVTGLEGLRVGVERWRAERGARWVEPFARFYMGERRTCAPGDACPLPTLSPEVMRAGPEVREAYEVELQALAQAVADGLGGRSAAERKDDAWALLALLSGGNTLARAVADPALSERIAKAVRRAATKLGEPRG